ncbi:MAG: phosphoenolpyruvate--protein phosphotransferase [Gammaproteobacteria bacterium]|nr:phosphoenolpyruvate--protein phosphotransferase [Gammaproteobacteria bacterium]
MTIALRGLCASKGVAIGRIYIVDRGQLDVSEYRIEPDEIDDEVTRLKQATTIAKRHLRSVRERIPPDTSAEIASFIDTHLLMLRDSALTKVPSNLIRSLKCNAEWALKVQRDALVRVFDAMDDPYLRSRKGDVDQVVSLIQRVLLKQEGARHEQPDELPANHVILASDLTPADTVLLQHQGVVAFVTEYGGPTSHTAILARSLRIPAIVGMHQVRTYVRDNDLVIIDGRAGILLVTPDERTLEHYRNLQQEIQRHHTARKKLLGVATRTLDKQNVALHANVEMPEDVVLARKVGAEGVGLFRTEYLFMNRDTQPDEEEQYAAYSEMVKGFNGAPVTIRTLDIGADKPSSFCGPLSANPALGLRAVRLCLKEPSLFYPQLRAILRSSVHGSVRLMIPMLTSLRELSQVLKILSECRRSLKRDGLRFSKKIPVGAMIEVPAAALCADLFAKHLDFFSIGTNDLIQYAIAIDRVDDEVNYLYDPLHPAVLRLIRMTIKAGRKAGVPVGMCGEMAGNSHYTRMLLGMGLTEFSVSPQSLLEVKQIINSSNARKSVPLVKRIMYAPDSATQASLLAKLNSTKTTIPS